MSPWDYAKTFLNNAEKIQKYNKAIDLLRESGFETVVRRLGEPTDIPLDVPMHHDMSAFEHAEKRGWFQAAAFIFDFAQKMKEEEIKGIVGDYGARERLEDLGYNDIPEA